MIPREKIVVAVPVHNFLIDVGCVGGLLECVPYYVHPMIFAGHSNIAHARNIMAHNFMKSSAEWLMWIDADTCFTRRDWEVLWEGDELIVCADYAKKFLGLPPNRGGLGFCRVHRSVYEKIQTILHEDGEPRAMQFRYNGEILWDYHPNGALANMEWIGEDHGFFSWVRHLDIKIRFEERTRLGHAGRFVYGYPDQIPGFKMVDVDEGAQ